MLHDAHTKELNGLVWRLWAIELDASGDGAASSNLLVDN